MNHQAWLETVKEELGEIKDQYAQCPADERSKWRIRLQQIKKSCDRLLESWAYIEEQIATLVSEYPDLTSDELDLEEECLLHESVVRQFRQGQGYYGLTMFKEAGQLFKQVVKDEPDFLLGRIYLGLSYFQENQLDEASQHFQLVSQTATHEMFTAFAYHMLGCIAVKQQDDRRAIKLFSKVVDLIPDQSDAWFNQGACHFRLGEYHEAIPCFYYSLSVNEDDWESMYYLSSCYRYFQEWSSVSFWRLASYEKTHHPEVLLSIAQDYEEMGQPEEAIYWYQCLVDKEPRQATAYYGIAWNLWVLQKQDQALLWIKKGLSLFPNHPDLLLGYIWFTMMDGEMEKAESAMQTLPSELKEKPIWMALRSRLSIQMGQFDHALCMAHELIENEQASVQALGYFQKGRTLLELGKVQEAIFDFQQAQRLSPKWKDPLFFEGICHMIEGRPHSTQTCWGQMVLTKIEVT
ncbi:tetratricopeptide repeat protein [Hazenella coriacea]|uniref:Tetratricopeptide repeat protein n=1 Tax=Hazenella coriacea TaxID=1179467 RepID=A0A4R3L1R3_9BACL|nr:tetratricopeptide repeat protein [Hazenella coriacea]TCS93359.1 tetratricopeptide repeat protein [Hazenella coriacea]